MAITFYFLIGLGLVSNNKIILPFNKEMFLLFLNSRMHVIYRKYFGSIKLTKYLRHLDIKRSLYGDLSICND